MIRSKKIWMARAGLISRNAYNSAAGAGGAPSQAAYAVRLVLRIANYAQILQAYGQAGADVALAHLHHRVAERFAHIAPHTPGADTNTDTGISMAFTGGGTLAITVRHLAVLEDVVFGPGRLETATHRHDVAESCDAAVEWFCFLIASLPVMVPLAGGGLDDASAAVHLVLTGSWALPGEVADDDHDVALHRPDDGQPARPGAGRGVRRTAAWAARYRADMAVAARVLAAIAGVTGGPARERLVLEWQPVCDSSASNVPLYYSARPGLLAADGCVHDLKDACQALERIGLAHLLDRHVLSQVVDELEACPDIILGATLFAHSLRGALWWGGIYARLAENAPIARRLIITLAELGQARAAPHGMASGLTCVAQFVHAMRDLGCMVVVDDAGMGTVSAEELDALAPDIMRIGDFFFGWAGDARHPGDAPIMPASEPADDVAIARRDRGKPRARHAAPDLHCLGWVCVEGRKGRDAGGATGNLMLAAWQAMAALDSGRVGRAYDEASATLKQMFSRKAFVSAVTAIRSKHGHGPRGEQPRRPRSRRGRASRLSAA